VSPCTLIGSTVGQAAAGRAAARTFVSHSSYCRYQLVNDQQAVYPTKYLISLTLGGLPPHTLNIKVGASVMQWHALRRYIVRHITAQVAYSMRRILRRCWMNQFYARGHGKQYVASWRCGDPHSDTTSNSVYTTVKLPTLCTRKCYQESAYRCMYCIPFIIFYVHVLKLRSCMLDRRFASCQPLSDRHQFAVQQSAIVACSSRS